MRLLVRDTRLDLTRRGFFRRAVRDKRSSVRLPPDSDRLANISAGLSRANERRAALASPFVPMIASTTDGRRPDRHAFHPPSFR
jgi:hypothetical protein